MSNIVAFKPRKATAKYSPENLDTDEYEVHTSFDVLLALRDYFIVTSFNQQMLTYINKVISDNLYSGVSEPVCTSKLYAVYEETVRVEVNKRLKEMEARYNASRDDK